MQEFEISAATIRRLTQVSAAVLVGAVVGGAFWWERASSRWWEEGRPFFPGYIRRWAGRVGDRGRNARQMLRDATSIAHDVSAGRSTLRRG